MTESAWEGIPEKYHPNPEKPWRVTWGIGCFKDFAAREDAEKFSAKQDDADRPFRVDADGAHYDDCEGHPSDEFHPMGETVYCDGSCRSA